MLKLIEACDADSMSMQAARKANRGS
jgi:hypothetical protein